MLDVYYIEATCRNYKTVTPPQVHYLKVKIIKRSDYFINDLVPNAVTLYNLHPLETEEALLGMLSELKVLIQENKSIKNLLLTTPFVPADITPEVVAPSATQSSSTKITTIRSKLFVPQDLFDPSVVELRSLLENSSLFDRKTRHC